MKKIVEQLEKDLKKVALNPHAGMYARATPWAMAKCRIRQKHLDKLLKEQEKKQDSYDDMPF